MRAPSGGSYCATNRMACSVLMLVVHHLILDAASEKILLSDLIAGYSDPDAPRALRAYDFADLAAHERACLTSQSEMLKNFWARNLAGAKLTFDLPSPCIPCLPEERARSLLITARNRAGSCPTHSRSRHQLGHDAVPFVPDRLPDITAHVHRQR